MNQFTSRHSSRTHALLHIYLNNLYEINVKGDIINFADDIVIFYEVLNRDLLKNYVVVDLLTIFVHVLSMIAVLVGGANIN